MFDGNELHSICCRAKTLMFVPWEAMANCFLVAGPRTFKNHPSKLTNKGKRSVVGDYGENASLDK